MASLISDYKQLSTYEHRSSLENIMKVKTVDQNKIDCHEIESLAIAQNNNTNGVNQKRELRRSINSKRQRQNARVVKKQPSREDLLASEIGNNLVIEVRRLRKEVKELEAIRSSELQKHEYAVQQQNQLGKQQERMKDEIWALELKNQELEQELEIAHAKVSRMTTENARLKKQLDQIHSSTMEQHKAEQETNNTARRQLEQHRIKLVKELRTLKKENANIHQQLQTATTEASIWKNKAELLNNTNQPLRLPPNPSEEERDLYREKAAMTPSGPPFSIQATNHEIKMETLQSSLEYAQQTISSLRMMLDKEKLDRIETKKMLAENQEMMEELRRDALTNQSHRRKKQHRRQSGRQHFNSKCNSIIRMDSSSSRSDSDSESGSASITDHEEITTEQVSKRAHIRNSLFDEIINSSEAHNDNEVNKEDKGTQTEKELRNNKIDVQIQTDDNVPAIAITNGRKDVGVQYSISSADASSSIPSPAAHQHPQYMTCDNNINNNRLNYLEPIKRALYETSTTLRKRTSMQQPISMNDNIRPIPTVSTPPSLSMTKQQLKQKPCYRNTNTITSIKHSASTATTTSSASKSKLLTYAAKYNNAATSRSSSRSSNYGRNNNYNYSDTPMALPPAPIPSISIAHPRHKPCGDRTSLTTAIMPCASVSDSLTAINSRRSSRATSSYLSPSDTTLHTLSEGVSTTTTISVSSSEEEEEEEEEETLDPSIVQSVTQTMIGNWLWKNTRNYVVGKNGISHRKGHMRYVWVHPYTRTLYWGPTQPGIDHDESKSKRAFIKDVWSVPCTDNPCPRVPYNLLIRTSARDLIFHAQNMDQHHQWIAALCYLLGRPDVALEKDSSHTSSSQLESSVHGSTSYIKNGKDASTTCDTTILTGSIIREGGGSSSTQGHQTEEECDSDDSEDYINIRQCCNGKHDISTLARK